MSRFPKDRVMPFPALVGQDQLKLGLLMLAVNPKLGGLLIRGEKGTAKSTAARGLARLMPVVRVNAGCHFGCAADRPRDFCDECRERREIEVVERRPPFETLPLGITEDQLLGSIDLERVLRHGEQRFQPGLLARVNQGVLYVDEVNLLDDHIVDLLLDAAAMGVNVVAREGVAVSHPAEFMLVGTMNPDEGDLRPQLLDRFGLCAEIRGLEDADARAEVVTRRLEFEADPAAFYQRWREEEDHLTATILGARQRLAEIRPGRRWCLAAANLALSVGADGHRADILLVKGAATLAALDGRREISAADLEAAAGLVLPHRLRPRPFEEPALGEAELRGRARAAAEQAAEEEKKKPSPSR
jgi:Mg-chelatase subunit ChlI